MNKSVYEKMFNKTPDIVNARIEQEVKLHLNEDNHLDYHFRNIRKIASVACVAACIVGTTAFASDKIYNTYIKQEGYQAVIYNNSNESESGTETAKNNYEDNKYIAVDTAYLPDGCEYKPQDGKFNGITIEIKKLFGRPEIATTTYVISTEEYHFDGKTGYILVKDGGAYDKECYVIFDNCDYIIHMYVSKDIDIDETKKILEGCSFYGTDDDDIETKAVARSREWLDKRLDTELNGDADFPAVVHSDNSVDVSRAGGVGSTVTIRYDDKTVDYTLNSYQFADSLNDINYNNNSFIKEFKANKDKLLNDDRTLKPLHIKTIKTGDGVSTLNEIINERDADMVFLVLDLTMDVKMADNGNSELLAVETEPRLKTTYKPAVGYDTWDDRNLFEYEYAIYNDLTENTIIGYYSQSQKENYRLIYVVQKDRMNDLFIQFERDGIIVLNYE